MKGTCGYCRKRVTYGDHAIGSYWTHDDDGGATGHLCWPLVLIPGEVIRYRDCNTAVIPDKA